MPTAERETLAIIGAGPKGIAVALKAKILEEFGLETPQVVIFEKNGVAAHWSGEHGYTNGEMKLGTSPEKDVVFPLETDLGDATLNRRVRQRLMQFTWTSFLADTGRLSDWVDRGRPAPCHQLWAQYLAWIAGQLTPQSRIVEAEVVGIDLSSSNRQWLLELKTPKGPRTFATDGVMFTGPGLPRADFLADESSLDGVFDLEGFWQAIRAGAFSRSGRTAIIGAGENAASALLALAQHAPELSVDVISPRGFVSTRSENFYENQAYSQPERINWSRLALEDRENFIERTDLGVFSVQAMSILNEQRRHQIIAGRVARLERKAGGLALTIDYHGARISRAYDQVILATGFDQVTTLKKILSPRAVAELEGAIGARLSQKQLALRIASDLAVDGFFPRLYLPMLAGLSQGPGFANLSCLGRLSDRILGTDSAVRHEVEASPRQEAQP